MCVCGDVFGQYIRSAKQWTKPRSHSNGDGSNSHDSGEHGLGERRGGNRAKQLLEGRHSVDLLGKESGDEAGERSTACKTKIQKLIK